MTHLAVAMLLDVDESLLLKSRHLDGFDETVVDRAQTWLDAVARQRLEVRPRLSCLLLCASSAGLQRLATGRDPPLLFGRIPRGTSTARIVS
jgi:hypothetical protein